jgi:hypothetical protein
VRLLERRGLLIADPEHPLLDFEARSSFSHLQAASIQYRIAIGPQAGRKAPTLYSVPQVEDEPGVGLVAKIAGFSLHAGTVCEVYQRSKLERLDFMVRLAALVPRRRLNITRFRGVFRLWPEAVIRTF